MKKIMMVVLVCMLCGCTSDKKEIEEPYITFQQDSFEVSYGETVNLISGEYIEAYLGKVTVLDTLDPYSSDTQTIRYEVCSEEDETLCMYYDIDFTVQSSYEFTDYPKGDVAFICSGWEEQGYDDRYSVVNPEYMNFPDTIAVLLGYDKSIRIHPQIRDGYWENERIVGTFTYLGDNMYEFEFYIYPPSYEDPYDELPDPEDPTGPYYGYFYREGEKIYYMGDQDNFENYQTYPYCTFGYSN